MQALFTNGLMWQRFVGVRISGRIQFLFAMIFSNTRAVQPATVGAHYFVGDELTQWDSITATAMFTALPGLIFFSIAQKAIVKGLTAGAVKG